MRNEIARLATGERVRTHVRTFSVSNLHCSACARTLEGALHGLPGVMSATVDAGSGAVRVWFDPRVVSEVDLVDALVGGGFEIAQAG